MPLRLTARPLPTLDTVTSQLCTASQFTEPKYAELCAEIAQTIKYHRKQWEYVYILRALQQFGLLSPGRTGVGFGCGKEPLPAVMAKCGCDVICTDIPPTDRSDAFWGSSDVKDFFYPGICSWEVFEEHVSFRAVDMNAIPDDLGLHDFVWSSCAFEHLGSLEAGIRFVLEANKCLKPGGIGVHTTEFNVSSKRRTLESPNLSLYRRKDIRRLKQLIEAQGNTLLGPNLRLGDLPEDTFVDLPPYKEETHLKLQVERYVITSIGLIIRKN